MKMEIFDFDLVVAGIGFGIFVVLTVIVHLVCNKLFKGS